MKRSNRPTPLTMAPMGMAAQMSPAGAPPPQYLAAMLPGSPATLMPMPLRPQAFSPVTNLRDNPPCNTLFIGNLGDNASEAELRSLFALQPGYRWAWGQMYQSVRTLQLANRYMSSADANFVEAKALLLQWPCLYELWYLA